MATPPSDDTKTLFKLLADGDWHAYEQIRDALALTVPPGRALRKYEERLENSRKYRQEHNPLPPPLSEDERIRLGQNACAQITITSWKGRGIIQRVIDNKKEIRIKPGFRAWGLVEPTVEPESVEGAEGSTGAPPAESGASEGDAVGPQQAAEAAPEPPAAPEPAAPVPEVQAAAAVSAARDSSYDWPQRKVTVESLPECPDCGSPVLNQQSHDDWHASLKQDQGRSEMALLDEAALRTLLGDVMGLALDRFQQGMQGWLDEQFLQLSDQIAVSRPAPMRWAQGSSGSTRPY